MTLTVSHNAREPSVELAREAYTFKHNHLSISDMAKGNLDMVALEQQIDKLKECRQVLQEKKAATDNSQASVACEDQIKNDNLLIKMIAEKRMREFRR